MTATASACCESDRSRSTLHSEMKKLLAIFTTTVFLAMFVGSPESVMAAPLPPPPSGNHIYLLMQVGSIERTDQPGPLNLLGVKDAFSKISGPSFYSTEPYFGCSETVDFGGRAYPAGIAQGRKIFRSFGYSLIFQKVEFLPNGNYFCQIMARYISPVEDLWGGRGLDQLPLMTKFRSRVSEAIYLIEVGEDAVELVIEFLVPNFADDVPIRHPITLQKVTREKLHAVTKENSN